MTDITNRFTRKVNRFTREAPAKTFEGMGYFIWCPLNGSNDRLTWAMCQRRKDKGFCKDSKKRGVKMCPYYRRRR